MMMMNHVKKQMMMMIRIVLKLELRQVMLKVYQNEMEKQLRRVRLLVVIQMKVLNMMMMMMKILMKMIIKNKVKAVKEKVMKLVAM